MTWKKEEYVEQTVFYPKKETISVFKTNEEGYLVTPEELKCSTYRIEEVKAPEGFVRQGHEMSLYEGETVISPLEVTGKGSYKENPKKGIVIIVSSDTAHQIDPDTGTVIVEVEQPNDEQVGSLTLTKTGEQPVEVKGDSLLAKAKRLAGKIKDAVTGEDTDTGVFHDFVYEESGVEGAAFELYAKDTIYSPDGAKNEQGNPVIRYVCLKNDANSKVACEVLATKGTVIVAGEITSAYEPDVFGVIKKVLSEVGYSSEGVAMDTFVHQQSPDIANAVRESKEKREGVSDDQMDWFQGAGDQGVTIGYACDETPQLMPMPVVLRGC